MQTLCDSLPSPEPWEPRDGLGLMESLHPIYRELSFELRGSSSPLDSVEPQVWEGHAQTLSGTPNPTQLPQEPCSGRAKEEQEVSVVTEPQPGTEPCWLLPAPGPAWHPSSPRPPIAPLIT